MIRGWGAALSGGIRAAAATPAPSQPWEPSGTILGVQRSPCLLCFCFQVAKHPKELRDLPVGPRTH